MDLFNRKVIGYDIGKKIDTQLVKNALGNAIGRRGLTGGLIFHSDRGCPYDNSCVESFFASLKKEKIYRRKYDTMEEAKKDVFWYIELFYNRKRRHSTLQYMTPVEYLRKYDKMKTA